jgi:sulfur carrier protein ThiS
MRITIELSSWFKRYTAGQEQLEVDACEGATVAEAVKASGIPIEEVGFIVRNNEKINEGLILSEGDRIKLYPYIIGG